MKKILAAFIAAAMTSSFAASLYGCGTKTGSVSESNSGAEQSVPETTEQHLIIDPNGNVLSEKPTERVRDIEETAGYEYEIQDGKAVITRYTGTDADVTVPAEIEGAPVTEIGFYAFEACYNVKTVALPESITLIGEGAFMDCSSMTSINIPEAVTGIDRGAFVACTSLQDITIPAAVSYIHEEAFTACESMTSLTINNPDLKYENWGLEELPELTIYADSGSAVLGWAEEKGLDISAR